MHDSPKVSDAVQANMERCMTPQKGEMQDRPKVRDAVQANKERCMTPQKGEMQDRPKGEMHYSPKVLTLQAVQLFLSLPLLYLPLSCRHSSPVSILYTLCTSPPYEGPCSPPVSESELALSREVWGGKGTGSTILPLNVIGYGVVCAFTPFSGYILLLLYQDLYFQKSPSVSGYILPPG